MPKILIGNIKGPVGPAGPAGKTGPTGPVGPQGPLPPLANNFTTTQAGVAALDAAAGKQLKDGLNQVNSDTSDIKNKGFGKGTDLFCGQDNNIKDCNNLPVGSVAYVYGNSINGPVANENAVVFTFGLPTLYTQLAVVLSRSSLKVRCKYTTGWSQWVEK